MFKFEINGFILYKNQNGLFHREDGPAVIWPDGCKEWRQNGILHRLDGPAIEADLQSWYYYGKRIDCNSQKEFESFLKLKAFW